MKTLSIPTVMAYLVILMIIHSLNASAKTSNSISCESTYGTKKVFISENEFVLLKNSESKNKELARAKKIDTEITFKKMGFTKTAKVNDLTYRVHVEDVRTFSESTDFLAISNKNGHTMTYPINCKMNKRNIASK